PACRRVFFVEHCGVHPIARPSGATEPAGKFAATRLQLERNIVTGKGDLRFWGMQFAKSPRPMVALRVFSVLLLLLLQVEPALADACPEPSFAAARTFEAGDNPA